MMQRAVHLRPRDLLNSLQFKDGDFGKTAFISGQGQRARMCLENLENPIKNFTFLGYTFWTGLYKHEKITVGNGGFYSPDSAFVTELLCEAGVQTLIRLGSAGALREDIGIGDFIVVDKVLRGDGVTRYYVNDDFSPFVDEKLTQKLINIFKNAGNVHRGGVWTTDALFKETKEIVNPYIEKGAIAVDMVTSAFVTVANLYKRQAAVILTVSDNLITGELGFADFRFFDAEMKMTKAIFEMLDAGRGF